MREQSDIMIILEMFEDDIKDLQDDNVIMIDEGRLLSPDARVLAYIECHDVHICYSRSLSFS